MKKILVLTAVLFLCLSLSSCKKKELQDDIYIFFTSDVHCGVDENISMASLKALVKDTKAEHQHVVDDLSNDRIVVFHGRHLFSS